MSEAESGTPLKRGWTTGACAAGAARAAPLAQAPVVQPRLSGVPLSASDMRFGVARVIGSA